MTAASQSRFRILHEPRGGSKRGRQDDLLTKVAIDAVPGFHLGMSRAGEDLGGLQQQPSLFFWGLKHEIFICLLVGSMFKILC